MILEARLDGDFGGSSHRLDTKLSHMSFAQIKSTGIKRLFSRAKMLISAVRPKGAFHQWRKVPPRELSIAPVLANDQDKFLENEGKRC
jgi:hypothetical protein